MKKPKLLIFGSEQEYRKYYKQNYCQKGVITFDGIRVYFREHRFYHAFFESRNRDSRKDAFSNIRAQRMNWIRATLENPGSLLFQGWDKRKKRYVSIRRVCFVYEDFVVVIEMRQKKTGELKAEFVTCFQADNSIKKIKRSPRWTKERCVEALNKKGR